MIIVGSALSNSPPISRSLQSPKSMRRRTGLGGRALSATTTYSSGSERHEETVRGPSISLEPGRPTARESRWLNEMCREKEKSIVEKFDR
jgi:hypothetical protein